MRDANFLPHEIRERKFIVRKNFLDFAIVVILIVNIFLALHIFRGIGEFKVQEDNSSNFASQVFNNVNYKEKVDLLDFFQQNIVGDFIFEGAQLKGSTLNLKIIIKDRNEFAKSVKKLESIKKCTIGYLIAPYEENALVKFEVGLEVKE